MSIAYIGEALGFHPLLFYLYLMLSSQFLAIFIFLKLLFKKVTLFSLVSIFLIFALNSYKISLISSGSWYGLTHAILLVYYSILLYILKNLETLEYKTLSKYGIFFGFILTTFFSLSANYVPFILYSTIILGLIFFKKIISNFKNFCVFVFTSLIAPIILLFPIYKLLLIAQKNEIRTFLQPVNNENLLDALTIRQWSFASNKYLKVSLFLVILTPTFYFFKKIKKELKTNILLIITTILTVVLLLGNNFYYNIYLFIFSNFPLMQSMRSSHRLYFYLLFVAIYIVSKWILNKNHSANVKYLWLILLIIVLSKNILVFDQRVDFKYLPKEYFYAREFLNNLNNAKVLYLPAYPPRHKSLLNAYEWALSDSPVITIYSNPFTAYLPFKGLISYEQYYYPEYGYESVMEYSQDEFNVHIDDNTIEYLIYDGYFDWNLFPDFFVDTKKFQKIKQFNKIIIYKKIY